jgi:hypothetical protein
VRKDIIQKQSRSPKNSFFMSKKRNFVTAVHNLKEDSNAKGKTKLKVDRKLLNIAKKG